MGFKRQLSAAEIFEQAYRFSQELQARGDRLSNVVRGCFAQAWKYKCQSKQVQAARADVGVLSHVCTTCLVGC